MKLGNGSVCLFLLVLLVPFFSLAADYPAPETYLADGRYSDYQAAALGFLKANPDAPEAPRVAMDLIEAATVAGDPLTLSKMRRLLLLNYTSSTQAKFLLLQYHDANEFGQFMYGVFAESIESPPAGFAARFDAAMRAGLKQFNGNINGPPEFIAFVIAMAHEVGDHELEAAATDFLSKSGERAVIGLSLASTLTDDKTPLPDRVAKLHAMPNRGVAIAFERFLISKMSEADKSQPAMLRVQADDYIFQHRLFDALPVLEKIPDVDKDARLAFWRAAAFAAGGDDARAARMFGETSAKFPNDPWGKQAAVLQGVVNEVDHTINSQTDLLLALFSKIKPNVGRMEFTATYEREDHTLSNIYCGLVAGARFELSASKNGVVEVGCRSTADSSAYYFGPDIPGVKSDNDIHSFSVAAVVLAPSLQWNGSSLSVNGNGQWLRMPSDLVTRLDDVLKLPILQNRDAMLEWMRQSVRAGRFPMAAAGNDVKTFVWLTPDPTDPTMARMEYSIDEKNMTLTFSDGGFKITSLHFAPADAAFDLKPPAWPAAKEVKQEKIPQSVASAVVPAIQAVLGGVLPGAATQPTTAPSTPPVGSEPGK